MPSRDERFMQAALDAARAVAGQTGDNPPVGCVIVRDGRVVASGATQPPGGAHAEVMAIRAAETAGLSVTGAELYVILEPCSFTGRTPPCSRLLVETRPRRVVVGLRDPHPRVRGAGIAELRAAGIEVVEGVLAAPIRELLAGWLTRFGGDGSPGLG
jgi:diaminohydroxyphosphoribosylaminopyrimidine deaminase/5-amino-6-(5-phosphoribosylamino)uracil reductase